MDLGGRDALRKLLILVREAGVHIDTQNVDVQPLIPQTMNDMAPEEFWKALEAMEPVFSEAATAAARDGKKLRYVARYSAGTFAGRTPEGARAAAAGQAAIGLQAVAPEHPAYYLKGTENAIIVRSALKPYPLLIKGPGEGPIEAASSILSDILR
jgi:aspartokinase/homoserine dehydrogenase 1